MIRQRIAVAVLSLSMMGFAAIVLDEGYTDRAIIPTKGDVPTIGFGSTFHEDGTPVKIGDTTTPHQAIKRTLTHIEKDERGIKACVTAPLTQTEYDLMVDFSYQYGIDKLCRSEMVKQANAGNYQQSCSGYLAYRYAAKYDCSTMINGRRNTRCWGVWERSQERHKTCMAVQ